MPQKSSQSQLTGSYFWKIFHGDNNQGHVFTGYVYFGNWVNLMNTLLLKKIEDCKVKESNADVVLFTIITKKKNSHH